MFFWNSLAFSMIQRMLAIWSLVPLLFLNPSWTSGSSWFMYHWSLAWRILSITIAWDEHNCVVVWAFFGIVFLRDWNENWHFPVLWPLLSFPLVTENMLFQQHKRRLYTWTSANGQYRNQIDYILCSWRWRNCGGDLVAQSCPTLATPWTVARQAPLSMGFSRQEYWSGLPFPSPGDLPGPGKT